MADQLAELLAAMADPARRARLPAGMRNNNPGNIKFVGQRVPGIVGPSQNTDQGDPQAVFDNPQHGMQAMVGLLRRKYQGGKHSANDMIAGQGGWTPGNFGAAANVARAAGLPADADINFNDPASASRFVRGLVAQEHGPSSKLYPDDLIMAAINGSPIPNAPTVFPDGPKGQEVAPPPLTQGKPVLDHPVANPMEQSIDVAGQGAPAPEGGLSRIFAALAPAAGQMAPAATQGGPTQSFGGGDPMGATIAAAQAAQKARGLSSGLMPDIAGLMALGKRPGAALG